MAVRKAYETLHDLLILKMQVLLDVERQLVKALPKMAKAATDESLKEAFTQHLAQTEEQAQRIEDALQKIDAPAKPAKSEAIRGLVDDAQWCIKTIKDPQARDALIIAAAQYIEHYEMAGYGAARTWAELMQHNDVAQLLQMSLDEEGEANKKLTELAKGGINQRASDMEEQ